MKNIECSVYQSKSLASYFLLLTSISKAILLPLASYFLPLYTNTKHFHHEERDLEIYHSDATRHPHGIGHLVRRNVVHQLTSLKDATLIIT